MPANRLSREVWQKGTRKSLSKHIHKSTKQRMEVILVRPYFRAFLSKCLLRPVERASSQVGSGDLHKTCESHPNQKGHTIEECIEFKNAVCHLIDMDITPNIRDDSIIIACDELRIDIPVTERIIFYHCLFTSIKKTMLEIYSELAQNVVFTHFYKGMDMPYSLWYEVQKLPLSQ